MHSKLLLAVLLSLAPAWAADVPAPKPAADAAVQRHPLRGVIIGVLAEKSALLVKHEEIPGVMRAMTMAFRVDAATLRTAKEGQAIVGLLSRQGDAWVLENVQVVNEKKR